MMKKATKLFLFSLTFMLLLPINTFAETTKAYKCKKCEEVFDTKAEFNEHRKENEECKKATCETIKIDEYGNEATDGGWVEEAVENAINNTVQNTYKKNTSGLENIFKIAYIKNIIQKSFKFEEVTVGFKNTVDTIISYMTKLSIGLIFCLVLKQILMTWLIWKDNPDENPIEIIYRIVLCIAIMYSFKSIYEVIINLIIQMNGNLETIMQINERNFLLVFMEDIIVGYILFKIIFVIIFIIQYFKAIYNTMRIGMQLLILRIGMPLSTLSLLGKSQFFSNYIMNMLKAMFTILINAFLLNLSIYFMFHTDQNDFLVIATFVCLGIINHGGEMLNNIMIQMQGSGYNPITAGISQMATSVVSRGLIK